MQFNDERMLKLFKNLSLTEDRFEFLFPYYLVLLHDLHCVESASIFLPHQDHS